MVAESSILDVWQGYEYASGDKYSLFCPSKLM